MDDFDKADQGIIRVIKDARYFTASNEPFNDKNLRWETRGLLGYLFSKPDSWEVRIKDLLKQGPAGEYKIRQMLDDARSYGYVVRVRIQEETGTFTWKTYVYESPSLNPFGIREDVVKVKRDEPFLASLPPTGTKRGEKKTSSRFSTSGKTTRGSPTSGKPPSILNTDEAKTEVDEAWKAAFQVRYTKLWDFYVSNITPKVAPLMRDIIRNNAIEYDNVDWYDKAFEIYVKNGATSWNYMEEIFDRWQKEGFGSNGFEKENKKTKSGQQAAKILSGGSDG